MGNQWLKYAALGAIVLAVVLGVLAYRMTLSLTASAREQARQEAQADQAVAAQSATTLAIIALRPLAATRPISAEDVALKPVSVVPQRYFTKPEDVIGRAPLIDVDAGAPVTPRYFRDSNVLARLIPDGHQAVSLEVSDVVAVGGFVRPGDEVDLLLFLRGADTQPQARLLLSQVLVLAYEERIIERPEGLTKEEGRSERRGRVRTAVVAVPEDKTTKIMLGASLGEIRLALYRQSVADAVDAPSSGGSPLPAAPGTPAPSADAEDAPEKTITLAELARLQTKSKGPPKPPPYVIEVYRGSEVKKVTD